MFFCPVEFQILIMSQLYFHFFSPGHNLDSFSNQMLAVTAVNVTGAHLLNS